MSEEVRSIGEVCVYCYENKSKPSCCGENHFEEAYEDEDGNIILHSDLRGFHEIVDNFTDSEGPFGGDYLYDCAKDDKLTKD